MVDWPAVLEAARAVLAGTEMTSGILRLTKEGWAHLSAQHPQPRHEVMASMTKAERLWLSCGSGWPPRGEPWVKPRMTSGA